MNNLPPTHALKYIYVNLYTSFFSLCLISFIVFFLNLSCFYIKFLISIQAASLYFLTSFSSLLSSLLLSFSTFFFLNSSLFLWPFAFHFSINFFLVLFILPIQITYYKLFYICSLILFSIFDFIFHFQV